MSRNVRRLGLTCTVLAALAAAAPGASAAVPDCRGSHWVGAWATSPSNAAGSAFVDQSLRLIVTPTLGGRRVRVRLSNRLGSGGVTFSSAFVARRRGAAALVAGTSRRLRFGGRPRVTIAPGREVVSDSVRLRFQAFQELAVSVHVQGTAAGASQHLVALQTSYSTRAGTGDHAGDGGAGAFTEELGSWPYLTDVEVRAPRRVGSIVALGDSITEGFPGPVDRDARYTDFLARRLAATARPRRAVQNAGISSNRLIADFPRPFAGPSVLHRLGADVLDQAGVSGVIVMAGTNDIGQAPPPPAAGARQVIAATQTLVKRLHRAGLRVMLATQTPAGGDAGDLHGTPEAVAKRNRINRWIRAQRSADGVVDFHAALRDPADPNRLRPAYDSGDHLHPSATGYRAMARAVPLRLVRGPACKPR
jgi:lysophospholipase L1-like esterase